MPRMIAVLGEYNPSYEPHQATDAAIKHSTYLLGTDLHVEWISTQAIDEERLCHYSGLWIAPGSPYKSLEKTLRAIRYAREHRVPCLGTCGGFQHMLLEYARTVLGVKDASHAEYDPHASNLFISRVACSLAGREMWLNLVPGSGGWYLWCVIRARAVLLQLRVEPGLCSSLEARAVKGIGFRRRRGNSCRRAP